MPSLARSASAPEPLLELHDVAVDHEPRPLERGLRVEPVVHDRGHELQVRLRLEESAHDAERPGEPPSRSSIPGMIVWYGRRPGSTAPDTRSPRAVLEATPVPGAQSPDPKPM